MAEALLCATDSEGRFGSPRFPQLLLRVFESWEAGALGEGRAEPLRAEARTSGTL